MSANTPAAHPPATRKQSSTLISRNITVAGHRTSMRLEPAMWDALIEICRREKLSIHQLCDIVAGHKPDETSFTAAMRVFAMSYFRAAATEEGHSKAGHGSAFLFSARKDFAGLAARKNSVDDESSPPSGGEGNEDTVPVQAMAGRRY